MWETKVPFLVILKSSFTHGTQVHNISSIHPSFFKKCLHKNAYFLVKYAAYVWECELMINFNFMKKIMSTQSMLYYFKKVNT